MVGKIIAGDENCHPSHFYSVFRPEAPIFAGMATSPFQSIFKKRLGRLRQLMAAPEKMTRQHERLHSLRIELKKWRAGLRLLRNVDPAFPYPEIYEPFKTLFAAAGQLRFWQLQRLFVRRTAHVPPVFARLYQTYARHRLNEAWEDFGKKAAKENVPRWRELKGEFRQSFKTCTPAAIQAYFDLLQKDIADKAGKLNRRRTIDLHELRKLLKEYANNRQLTVKHLQLDPGPPGGIPAENASFDELLGEWHDQDAACIQLAEDLRTQGWEGEVLRAGKAVFREWRRKEREMWAEITAALRKS